MNKPNFQFTKAELLKIVKVLGGDGHAIYKREFLAQGLGIASERLNPFTRDHVSGEGHKSTIYTASGVAEHMVGVYGLSMMESICRSLDIYPADAPMGRGFRMRTLSEVLHKYATSLQD